MTPPPPFPTGWKCPRRVGFLFPHDCHRPTPIGCPDCQNGQVEDPYLSRTDRYGYTAYDYYPDDYIYWVSSGPDVSYSADVPDTPDPPDFTEADGTDLVAPGSDDSSSYESDMSES